MDTSSGDFLALLVSPRRHKRPLPAGSLAARRAGLPMQILRVIVLAVVASGLCSVPMSGQVKSAAINGTVTDASGSAVAGAQLTVTEQNTNVSQNVVSNGSGEFSAPYLAAGIYTVDVQRPGFKSFRVTNINLTVGQLYRLDAVLPVGQVTETVNVLSNAAQLQTESSTVQSTVGEQAIKAIPNINQNPLYYATLQAGVVGRSELSQTQSPQSFGIGLDGRRYFSAININGGTAFTNDIQLDGLSILGSGFQEATVLPNTDSLQEVRVITNDYAADLGRGQGVIQMATKSGTNEFNGSIYYRLRNEALNANTFQNNYQGIPRGGFKVNDFGGSFGGPILHNKLFIFTSYEQLLHNDQPQWLLTVPTAAQRTGDFSHTLIPGQNGQPTPATIYNPYSPSPALDTTGAPIPGVYQRALYPNAIIPNPSAAALKIMGSYPLPNRTPTDVYGNNNYFISKSRQFKRSSSNSRLDFHPNEQHSIYVTGGVAIGSINTPSPYGTNSPFYLPPTNIPGNSSATQPKLVQDDNPYLAIGDTVILSPTAVLDLRYGIERVHMNYLSNTSTSLTAADYASYGIPANVQSVFPLFGAAPDISPGGNFSALSNTQYNNKRERQTNQQVVGSLTKTVGRWIFRGGAEYRVGLSNYNDFQQAAASYGFAGTPTAEYVDANGNSAAQNLLPAQHGYTGANILTGQGGWNSDPAAAARLALAQKYIAIYSQNDWRPSEKLVVNLGLRWEVQPGPTERYNRSGDIDLAKTNAFGSVGEIVFPGNNGLPRNLWKTTWTNYQPRIGLSYRATSKLVLRGGYGISYAPNNTGWYDGPYSYGTAGLTAGSINKDYGYHPDGVPVGHFYDAVSSPVIAPGGTNPAAPQVYGRGYPYFNYNGEVPPRIQQWNVFVERQFGAGWLTSIGYVASKGANMQIVAYPIQNDQLIPADVKQAWRATYIATAAQGGAHNPGSDLIANPLQPTSGQLRPFQGVLGNATIARNITYYPHLALYPNTINTDNGAANYNSLLLRLRHSYSSGLLLDINYVWSKSTDTTYTELQDSQGLSDSPGGGGPGPQYADLLHPENDKKISFSDIPQRLIGLVSYQLPFGSQGKYALSNPVARAAIGDWTIGTVVTIQGGFPLPASNNQCNGATNCRPNRTNEPFELPKSYQHWYDGKTSVTLPDGRVLTPCAQCFLKYNIGAFGGNVVSLPGGKSINDIYWSGNAAIDYGVLRGPGRSNVDLSLSRTFRITERTSFSFRANATNAFNHTQFLPSDYAMSLGGIVGSSTTPGVLPGQGVSGSYGTHGLQTFDPRQIALEGRIQF